MQKPLRMTTVDLTQRIGNDVDGQMALENRYLEFEALQTSAVEARRVAAEAMADATIAEQRAAQSFVKFLRFAGEHADIVKREAIWLPPFRNAKSAIVLQSPMTRRDQRVAANLMHTELSERANEKLDTGSSDIWEDGEEDHQ